MHLQHVYGYDFGIVSFSEPHIRGTGEESSLFRKVINFNNLYNASVQDS